MKRFFSLSLSVVICCMLLSGCDSFESRKEQQVTIKSGTYRSVLADGSPTHIVVEDETFTIYNGNYQYCPTFYYLTAMEEASAKAQAEGFSLTEADEQRIKDQMQSIDYSVYDGVPVRYQVGNEWDNTFNMMAETDDGEPITGFFLTFYVDNETIGFGDEYYTLEE